MVTQEAIQNLTSRLVREYHPEKVILFGSYAYGTPHNGSDVDLLVIMPYRGNPLTKAAKILRKLNPDFGVDLLLRTSREMKQRLEWNDYFLHEVVNRGRVLYEAAD